MWRPRADGGHSTNTMEFVKTPSHWDKGLLRSANLRHLSLCHFEVRDVVVLTLEMDAAITALCQCYSAIMTMTS
jgi:hypothetical protein